MDMQKTPSPFQTLKLKVMPIVLLSALLVVCGVGIRMSTAQSQSEERVLEDKIPKHLPIKIKIKKEKEKAFKDLKNEKWLRDFELEVTNTGEKPIYFLDFLLIFPEITDPAGHKTGYPLRYGRIELVDLEAKVMPNDIPLNPGESYIFRLPESYVKGWERFIKHYSKSQPKKVSLHFRVLNFGDGTGFMWSDGAPFPRGQKGEISGSQCRDPGNKSISKLPAIDERLLALNDSFNPTLRENLLAESLPANFLSTESSNLFPLV
jgi:hypothetical protein